MLISQKRNKTRYRNIKKKIAREILEKHRTKYQKLVQDFVSFRFGIPVLTVGRSRKSWPGQIPNQTRQKTETVLFLYFKKLYIIFETEQNCVFIKKKIIIKKNRTAWKTLGPMFDLLIYPSTKGGFFFLNNYKIQTILLVS